MKIVWFINILQFVLVLFGMDKTKFINIFSNILDDLNIVKELYQYHLGHCYINNKYMNDMDFRWFSRTSKMSCENMKYLHNDCDHSDDSTLFYNKHYVKRSESSAIQYYWKSIKNDTDKYFLISQRRLTWFLLKKIHLDDCRLTYKSLLDPNVKAHILKELEILSKKLSNHVDIVNVINVNGKCSYDHKTNSQRELDVSLLNDHDTMTDERANELYSYAYARRKHGIHKIMDSLTFKVVLYDMLLLNNDRNETFSSFKDSSPMSGLYEDMTEYLKRQYKFVKSIVSPEEMMKLERISQKFNSSSPFPLNMFHIYRLFYVL